MIREFNEVAVEGSLVRVRFLVMKSSATAALLRLSRVFPASSWVLVVKLMNSGLLSVGFISFEQTAD